MANPIVNSLPAYVEQNKLPLIAKAVLKGKTADMLSLMTGVKGATALNLVGSEIVFQNAASCGFNASGSTTLSQRILTPQYLKINMEYCEKNLLNKWASYMVKTAATGKELPFEEDFVGTVIDEVEAGCEKMIWQGQSGQTAEFEGILSILDGADVSAVSADTAYKAILAAYQALPETAIADDTVIFVSNGMFRSFIQELVAKNLYHFEPNDKDGEYTLPGTAVKVVAVSGLNGTEDWDYAVAGRLSNIVLGVDMVNEEEIFDLWYSKDSRIFKLAIEFIMGVQVAYPDQMAIGKVAK